MQATGRGRARTGMNDKRQGPKGALFVMGEVAMNDICPDSYVLHPCHFQTVRFRPVMQETGKGRARTGVQMTSRATKRA
jgi:hypothetical protein